MLATQRQAVECLNSHTGTRGHVTSPVEITGVCGIQQRGIEKWFLGRAWAEASTTKLEFDLTSIVLHPAAHHDHPWRLYTHPTTPKLAIQLVEGLGTGTFVVRLPGLS